MFKQALIILVLSDSNLITNEKTIDLSGDYSEEAKECLIKNKFPEPFDPNDLLYETIIKEIKQEDHLKK
jgi:hypothetical protein